MDTRKRILLLQCVRTRLRRNGTRYGREGRNNGDHPEQNSSLPARCGCLFHVTVESKKLISSAKQNGQGREASNAKKADDEEGGADGAHAGMFWRRRTRCGASGGARASIGVTLPDPCVQRVGIALLHLRGRDLGVQGCGVGVCIAGMGHPGKNPFKMC